MARILLIDDHDALRSSVARLLSGAGHEVLSTDQGREAIAILESYSPELVITDVNMPEMDGIEVIVSVQDRRPDLPVIVISGGGAVPKELLLDSAVALGARCALAKPFTSEELLDAVGSMLPRDAANG